MPVRLVQWEKAHSPIDVTLFGIVMFVSLEHSLNASEPIEVTPSGIVMLVSLEHSLNAL